jgi:hypothetical protein
MGCSLFFKESDMIKGTPLLIVEDSLTQALQLQYFLEEQGFSVSTASNGVEALSCLSVEKPRLVISDIMMPEMNGYELCRQIKADPELRELPVILLTSLSNPHDVIKALECGADNFVTKPYNKDFLLSRIQNILLNQELRKHAKSEMSIEIMFGGRKHFITSDRMQILDLLFSTYENAVEKNKELEKAYEDLVAMQRELEIRNAELQRLNGIKNQFLGMAAHDLRTPLGVILAYSEFLLLEASGVLTAEQVEFLSAIKSSSEFILRVVNDLLDISKIEAGRLELDLKPTDLISLIEHNVSLNSLLARHKDIHVLYHYDTDRDLTDMMLDQSKIEQVLNNLISNAIKFSHPGSTIRIEVGEEEGEAVVSVRDEGPGIPPDEIDKLFTPFQTTSVTSTRGEKSAGLGLVIVRKMVEGHKGRVWVESELGKGSVFRFTLPIIRPAADSSKAHAAPVAAAVAEAAPEEDPHSPVDKPGETLCPSRTLRILLAEDVMVNQRMASRILEKSGFVVSVASNGREAVDIYRKEAFDLILMDVDMPVMDGLEATQAIRRLEKDAASRVPIIAMTGHAMKDDREKCMEAGMDGYISKPVDPRRLVEIISGLVSCE